MSKIYRTDIDGLRAFAVISVILFHLGFLPNGYLGVDIFFVISGYLITGIVFNEVCENKFSILQFYERRIRRILPLVLFTTVIAFLLGMLLMLPDDLENLCQSIIASNFSANNILMYITSGDYWAVKNDYKPLMHTWSLGIEEQFYLLYPVIFFLLQNEKKKFILPLLVVLTFLSLVFFFTSGSSSSKFYFLQYRFFELSVGGICAIYFGQREILRKSTKGHYLLFGLLIISFCILYFELISNNDIKILIITISSAGVLVLGGKYFQSNKLYNNLFSNQIISGVGKISFSLYMWHQIVFAFSRYFIIEEMTVSYAIIISSIVLILSILTYNFIENPFRNRQFVRTKPLLTLVSLFFIILTGASFYVYSIGGIIKDVPELGLKSSDIPDKLNFFDSQSNIHIQYNENVRGLNKAFTKNDREKTLVVGDSFARDFANILIESSLKETIEVSYYDYNRKQPNEETLTRFKDADIIFFATNAPFTKQEYSKLYTGYNIDTKKVWIVGTKDFGNSNGIHFNRKKGLENCQEHRTSMKRGILEINDELKNEWRERYIDLVGLIGDSNGKVLVFTPDCKFISQDTMHLTRFGSSYFANLLEPKLFKIFGVKTKEKFLTTTCHNSTVL